MTKKPWAPKPRSRSLVRNSRSLEQVNEHIHPTTLSPQTTILTLPGLPRTGTASFSAALSILLNGPVYHGGTQNLVSGNPHHIKTWIDILSRTPYQSAADKKYVKAKIRTLTDGYVAVADTPHALFVEELMELYPDAKVVCTVRDPDA